MRHLKTGKDEIQKKCIIKNNAVTIQFFGIYLDIVSVNGKIPIEFIQIYLNKMQYRGNSEANGGIINAIAAVA